MANFPSYSVNINSILLENGEALTDIQQIHRMGPDGLLLDVHLADETRYFIPLAAVAKMTVA